MPQTRSVTAVSLLALVLIAPAATVVAQDGTLRIGVGQGLVNPDPHASSLYSDVRILQQIYGGLLRIDPDTQEPVSDLAEDWEVSEDRLTWTFTLREDLAFHDGSALTAADVAHSFDRIRNPETNATMRSDFEPIETVETPDDRTVVIRLAQPYGILPVVLATPVWSAIVPEGMTGAELADAPIGAGPFVFEAQVERTSVTLGRFDDYHVPDRPRLEGVAFIVVPDESARVAALVSGQVDIIDTVAMPLVSQVEAAPGVSVLQSPSAWVDEFGMNTQRPPFDDLRVRQAIAMAIDKEQVAQAATFGLGEPADTMVAASPIEISVDPLPHDPERARGLLAEAGHATGIGFEFAPCGGNAFPHMMRASEVIARNLQDVGIDARAVALEASVWGDQVVNRREYDAFVCGLVNGVDPDQKTYRYFSRDGAYNFSQFEPSDALQSLLDEGRGEDDPARRGEIYSAAWQTLAEEVPWVPLYVVPNLVGVRDGVEGFRTTPDTDLVLVDVTLNE